MAVAIRGIEQKSRSRCPASDSCPWPSSLANTNHEQAYALDRPPSPTSCMPGHRCWMLEVVGCVASGAPIRARDAYQVPDGSNAAEGAWVAMALRLDFAGSQAMATSILSQR